MSLQDPISDMLTRLRNALAIAKSEVSMPASTIKAAIAKVLKDEGYILDYNIVSVGVKSTLTLVLKYYKGVPVIEAITRTSKPGLRIYKNKHEIPEVRAGMGIAIISTPKGVMTGHNARALGIGGEVLCIVN